MKKLSTIVFLSFAIIMSGCITTSKPMVYMEKDVSLVGYKVFKVQPVINETGKTYEFNVSNTLTQNIKSELRDKGFIVSDGTITSQKVLIIKSKLLSYAPGSALKRWFAAGFGKTQATVETSLIDKKTGKVVGEFVSAETVSSGGLYSAGADKWILDAIATGIVDEIEKKVKGE
jgi:hypothetical protein